ncbi:MAG: 26S protease regulatory subunit [Deltaproteobacteria bacterium]|nr:26S protease regulatory subunit [Deltaproteobacteria bacterium]
MGEQRSTPEDFGEVFKQFMRQQTQPASPSESVVAQLLRRHFEADPAKLPVVAQEFKLNDHPNLQVALDNYIATPGVTWSLRGFSSDRPQFGGHSLSDLLMPPSNGLIGSDGAAVEGPVKYRSVTLASDRVVTCVEGGLFLCHEASRRLALWIRMSDHYITKLAIEVMAPERETAETFLAELRDSMRKRNVYRGRVLTLDQRRDGNIAIVPRALPKVTRQDIILPEGLLDRIERQTVRFSLHAPKLLAAGRHLRRGILLHGAPGTGKTLTAMYLASEMAGRTVLVVTGRGMGLIEEVGAMARALQPATVVVEDVDLIAGERSQQAVCNNGVLFELLNEMDGLGSDADVLFLLTTNRPDMLEPALAARPGRVDMALEVPLPDVECRRRLFALYGRGLRFEVQQLEGFVERTQGVSAAFIRELVRKAALAAADERDELVVEDRHLDEALHELLVEGGGLTRSLLGAAASRP